MDKICKISTVFLNLLNLAAGIAASVIMIFQRPFAVVIAFKDMPGNAQLYLNLVMFQIGVVLLSVVISILIDKSVDEIKFPVLYMIIPTIISVIGIYFGIVSNTAIEKAILIVGSIVYVALSGILLYFSTKIFESFSNQAK